MTTRNATLLKPGRSAANLNAWLAATAARPDSVASRFAPQSHLHRMVANASRIRGRLNRSPHMFQRHGG